MPTISHVLGNVAIPSTVGLLRQASKKLLRVIGKKYPPCAEKLKQTYRERDSKGRRATEEELVRGVELTRAFFSEAEGKYTEEIDQIIAEMDGMLYGEEKVAFLVDPDVRWGFKDEDHSFCGYKVHAACDESEVVTSVDLLFGNENEGAEKNVRSLLGEEREQGRRMMRW